ncbi:MAG: DNA repair and recombination protein RadA [Thermoprotei archaeon]|nr:MAG: DNA repair and recombination protein RadA [Thermoprotei archaeon]RLF00928.1 MAG: DNA repair and recombination protein RadA [Thermoprotei archaeon]HDI74399.1 DNA repair and recombination protein RadA [Thermoprotei archaeon]
MKCLEEVPGVGPKTAKLLSSKGIMSPRHLALFNPEELIELVELTPDRAERITRAARRLVRTRICTTAKDYAEKMKDHPRLTTGVKAIDELLEGGIEPRVIYELAGEFGSGKTQICHQLSVTVQLSRNRGGVGGACLYIDTEEAFSPNRVSAICLRFNLDPSHALENINVIKVINVADLEDSIKLDAIKLIEEKNVRLILVDSIISLYRAEFKGREMLAARQQRLNYVLDWLLRIAKIYGVYVVVTNQVLEVPLSYGETKRPAGGMIMAHACTHRLLLKRSKDSTRIMEVLDSPRLPYKASAVFKITERGVEDV